MFIVLAWPRGKRPVAYGPFSSLMEASDYSHEHTDQTAQAAEVRRMEEPIVYGDEGL